MGRSHDKLGAALMRFGLPGAIRGARILEVVGSTPGFAAVLLELGADHVTTVSLGPTPLSPALRKDPRVAVVENADMKNLPASVATGPYSFFTIDVRFASARASLRAVAFRCKAPAHGIAWVRPQFEAAPEHKNRSLTGVALRDRAMLDFTAKAHALGFQLVAEADGKDGDEAQVAVHLSLPT